MALLNGPAFSDYSIHLDEETNILFGVLWRLDDHGIDELPKHKRDAALVGGNGRHHGDQPDNEPVAVPLETMFHME